VQILALVAITVIRFYRNLLDRSGKGFPVKFETIGVSRKLRGVRKTDFESERFAIVSLYDPEKEGH